jgi:hypothetical protein
LYRIDFADAGRKNAMAAGRTAGRTGKSARGTVDPIEHFWLCGSCAPIMTVELGEDGDVRTVPFETFVDTLAVEKPAAAAMAPQGGLAANAI